MKDDWRAFRRGFLYFVAASCMVWLALYTLHVRLPYLQTGADIVGNAKRSWSLTHPIFETDAKFRILTFGNSKTLASFNPRLFDADLAADGVVSKVDSMNEALPGERRYVTYLEQLLAAGARPTHVLIQFPPIPEDHDITWREWLQHDKLIVDTLFPFREMPRDFTLFVFSALGHGGLLGFYRESANIVNKMISDRGYYFIKGQSHFPGDRLPDDYRLPTDTPSVQDKRPVDTGSPPFVRLAMLARKFDFKVIVFPPAYRTGQFAPAPSRDKDGESLPDFPDFLILGDDYWLFAPKYFSDPIHQNVEGAQDYTARLAALIAPRLKRDER